MSHIIVTSSKAGQQNDIISSPFYITINTQQTDLKYVPLLKETYDAMVQRKEFFLVCKDNDPDFISKVISLDHEPEIEIGPIYRKIHLHTVWTFKHKTKIQLDQDKIRRYIAGNLNIPPIHLHIRYVRDNRLKLSQYIGKGVVTGN